MKADKIHIDTSKIPPMQAQLLGATFLAAVRRFYINPENVRRFEEWKRTHGEGTELHDTQGADGQSPYGSVKSSGQILG